jgi:hypothetical protein
MAAVILQEPGTEYGPCVEPCSHVDCAATRTEAALHCPGCAKVLGYGQRIAKPPTGDALGDETWHFLCLLGAVES